MASTVTDRPSRRSRLRHARLFRRGGAKALLGAEGETGEAEARRSIFTKRRLKWAALASLLGILVLLVVLATSAPLSKSLQPITAPSLTLLSAEGVPIARKGAVLEAPVRASRLPDHVVQPFLAIEDRRFFGHIGIDPQGLARAFLANLRGGGVVEGGSTITQQLAKLAFLSPEQTLWRKLQEAVLALWLEAQLGKDEILSRYLSSVYFGDNVYGLRAAARHYFGREPEALTLEQSAMLAGLLKAPSSLAPTKNLAAARKRATLVVQAMVDAGILTSAQAKKLPQAKLAVGEFKDVPSGSYFADWVLPSVYSALDDKYPAHRVKTTLEDRLQREAVAAIRAGGVGAAQVALVSMRRDGRIVAMVGGKSYERSPFNRATQALRQPGSTFKLFVYLAALEAGYRPHHLIDDTPLRIGNWSPQNYGGEYRGRITLRDAFKVSSNVAAVRLAERVGRDRVLQTARGLGVSGKLEPGPTGTLGTSGIPLIELVSAYAAVSAGVEPVRPTGLARRTRLPASAMNSRVRGDMLQLLWSAANEGTGRGAVLTTPTFGKTGTSQDSRDAYFIGFSGDLITGVWIGYDDNRPMGGTTGGSIPAAIWKAYMSRALMPADKAGPAPKVLELPEEPAAVQQRPAVVREYDVDEGSAGEDLSGEQALEGEDGEKPETIAPPDEPEPAPPLEDEPPADEF